MQIIWNVALKEMVCCHLVQIKMIRQQFSDNLDEIL